MDFHGGGAGGERNLVRGAWLDWFAVEFVLEEILGLSLNGSSHQNVLFGLTVERGENGFRLALDDSHGIAGTIDAKRVSIRLRPGKPNETL